MRGCYPYRYFYSTPEAHIKILCLQWPLPPPSPMLTQWPDELTVPTVHRAKKQPAHLPFVSYPQTSQTKKTRLKFSSDWSHSGQMSFAPMGICSVRSTFSAVKYNRHLTTTDNHNRNFFPHTAHVHHAFMMTLMHICPVGQQQTSTNGLFQT